MTNFVLTSATSALRTARPGSQHHAVMRGIDTYGGCALAIGLFAINPPLGLVVAAGSGFRATNLNEGGGLAATVAAAAGACDANGFCASPMEAILGLATQVVARNFTSGRGIPAVAA